MNIYQHRQLRLLCLIDEQFGGIRRALCDASGWSEARISQLLSPSYREGRVFTEKNARKLEADLNLEAYYFDIGMSPEDILSQYLPPGTKRVVVVDDDGEDTDEYVKIKRVKLKLSAGISGFQTEPDEEDGGSVMLLRKWVRDNGYVADRLVSVTVKGESMEPSLYSGDTVVVNTADTKLVDGAVFAVNYEGEAVIKRLSRNEGQWWLTSDNPDQRRYHRKSCRGGECIMVGRVVKKESDRI